MAVKFMMFIFFIKMAHGQNVSNECPVWMENAKSHCQCSWPNNFTPVCTEDTVEPGENICIGYDNVTSVLCTGYCLYSHHQREYSKNLNSSVTYSEFNEIMCGPLNREGLFCSKCKPGYGIPVFSKFTDKCVKCSSKLTSSLLYLALELVPLTLFYFIVIIFNFSATQPPITAYIFYCQIFTKIGYDVPFIKYLFHQRSNKYFLYLTLSIGDIWNLDILRYVIPPFCLSDQIGNIDALFFELISAIYPILLIILTIILIEMHASNFRIIVCMWKPFHKCFVSIRRSWDPRSSVINAFATFLLLSSFKICFLTSKLTIHTKLSCKGFNQTTYGTSSLDPNIDIYNNPYYLCSLILSIVLVFLPTLFLAFYPTRLVRRLFHCICHGRLQGLLFIFMECFQGHYKNGTTSTYDYRAASCIGFVLRLLAGYELHDHWYDFRLSKTSGRIIVSTLVLLVTSLFYALVQPYKKHYMNVIESLLYFTAGILLILIINRMRHPAFLYDIVLAAILLPSVVFVAVIMYKTLKVTGR